MKKTLLAVTIFFRILFLQSQIQEPSIGYMGETPPNETPKVFAKDIISMENRWEGNLNFSADGHELYFNVFQDSTKTIYRSILDEDGWSEPKPMKELKNQNTWEPFLTWDMQRLYFVSDRQPGSPEWDGRVWYMDRGDYGSWETPTYFEIDVAPKMGIWFPNVTKQKEFYFGAALKDVDSVGMGDMYRMDMDTKKVSLLSSLCSENEDWDPFVASDGSYILWASNRPGGYGETDLYVSFKEKDGQWGNPKNLGPKINTEGYEVAPRITLDGKYLFFDRPINGTQDIYWVATKAILKLRE